LSSMTCSTNHVLTNGRRDMQTPFHSAAHGSGLSFSSFAQ
jgi:hypothetical protein